MTTPAHSGAPGAHGATPPAPRPEKAGRGWRRAIKWIAVALGTVVAIVFTALAAVTLWLTPERLTRLINDNASQALHADVRAENVRFRIWSSFPHFQIECDSVSILSRSLDSVSPSLRRRLPDDYRRLLTCGPLSGGINLLKLIGGTVSLHDVEVSSLAVNLVSVNDSLANFNIFPTTRSHHEVPRIEANEVELRRPRSVTFTGLATGTSATLRLQEAKAVATGHKDSYRLLLMGTASARVRTLQVLRGFPLALDGEVALDFDPFRIRMEDYRVALGNIEGHVEMNLDMGDRVTVSNFSYSLESFDLMRFLKYLPGVDLPVLSQIHSRLDLKASARLTRPYRFSASRLPYVEVDLDVPEGSMQFVTDDGESYRMEHNAMSLRLDFDGDDPEASVLHIAPLTLRGEGAEIGLEAEVGSLLGDPEVWGSVRLHADLATTERALAFLRGQGLAGRLDGDLKWRFHLSDLAAIDLSGIGVSGRLQLTDFHYGNDHTPVTADARLFSLGINGDASLLTPDSLAGGLLRLQASADRVTIRERFYRFDIDTLGIDARMHDAAEIAWQLPDRDLPFDVKINAVQFHMHDSRDTLDFRVRDIDVGGILYAKNAPHVADRFSVDVSGGDILYAQKGTEVRAHGLDADFSSSFNGDARQLAPAYHLPAAWRADTALLGRVDHTPVLLKGSPSVGLRKWMANWRSHAAVRIREGALVTAALPGSNTFSNINVEASFDSLWVKSLSVRAGATALRLSAKARNFRQFMTSPEPAPLYVSACVALDTVDINQLARAYETGVDTRRGPGAAVKAVNDMKQAEADHKTMLLPRNLMADVHLSAKETKYTNLRLYDLRGGLRMADGQLRVDTLSVGSDFGRAGLSLNYRTAPASDMGLDMHLGIDSLNVVGFFRNFHKLLLMMPQMSNLSGVFSADMDARMDVFPNMDVNVPSVWADMHIYGRGLKVRQSHFIRHITKMLLIREDHDLHIANVDVHASVHDNLLELYPFDFSFSNYRLRMAGVNNFDGRMYYHIGVEKSLVPFPFGINVVGMFHHPKLRFGGPRYKVGQAQKILGDIEEQHRVNVMQEVKKYVKEFVHKAAESGAAGN